MDKVDCEWCGKVIGDSRRFRIVMMVPLEDGSQKKLYFHSACKHRFTEANPNLMRRKEQLELQVNR